MATALNQLNTGSAGAYGATPLTQLGTPLSAGSGSTPVVNPGGVLSQGQSNWPIPSMPGQQPTVNVNGLNINPNNLKAGAPLTILPAVGNSTAEGNAAYNASQPLQSAYTNNLTANPYGQFLQTGSTNNAGIEALLSAYGINTTPTQPGQGNPQQLPNSPRTATSPYSQPDGGINNGLGVTVSADQVNGLTGPQQTQLNGYIATTTQQQQQALSSFQSEMEGRFGAGALSPEASAVGQQVITEAYQAQVDQQVASYQTQAQTMRQQGLTAIEGQGVSALNAQQQQTLAEQETLQQQNQNDNQLAVSAGEGLGSLGLGMSAQNNSLNLGSLLSGLGSLGTGVAKLLPSGGGAGSSVPALAGGGDSLDTYPDPTSSGGAMNA